jgi:hypothetical protein
MDLTRRSTVAGFAASDSLPTLSWRRRRTNSHSDGVNSNPCSRAGGSRLN